MYDKRFTRISTAVILIPAMLGVFLYPTQTSAGIGDVAACATAGLVGSAVSYGVGLGLAALLGEVPVNDPQNNAKEYITDVLARCLARQVLDSSIGGMLDIVRKQGRDGGKSFVRNWRNFQTNAQYRGEAVFRGILANTQTCDYLQEDINKIFRVSEKDKISLKGQNTRIGDLDPFTIKGRCTLPSNFDMEKYKEDFSGNGGWGTFLRMLEPQNNYYGLVLQSLSEADKQKALEVSSDLQEAQAGRGYLSLRGGGSDSCLVKGLNNQCIIYSNVKSPGSYLADTAAATIQQELGWLTSADELNEVIANNITERLMARLQDFGADEENPIYETDPAPPPVCRDPTQPAPTPEPPLTPGQPPQTDRQIRLNSQIAQIHDTLQELSDNARIMTLFLDQRKGELIAERRPQSELDANKQAILGIIDAPKQGQALDLLDQFDRLARELYLGEGQVTDLPECSTEPPPVDCSLFPEDPSCSQEPPPGDENPPPSSDECVLKPPEEQFKYLDDIRAAQSRVADKARAGQDVGLDKNDVSKITDFNTYHSAVVAELNGAGFPLSFHDGEEIQICKSGDGFSEHSDISTASSTVRDAFNNAICRPAAISACNP